jgi:hypothetical protein
MPPLDVRFIIVIAALWATVAQAQSIPSATRHALNRASVTCEDAAHCNASVGMVAPLWERINPDAESDADLLTYSINRCTGTLVAPNLVLTNRHCLPPEIIQDGESPAGRVTVAFPASGDYPASTVRVSALAAVSSEPNIPYMHVADYALLRLARNVNRPVMAVSSAGPVMGATYTVPSITRVGEGLLANTGLLVEGTVEAIDQAPDQPSYSLWPMLFGLRAGRIRIGHSGSPLIMGSAMVGLLYGVAFPTGMTLSVALHSVFEEGYAMNMACVTLPGVPSSGGPVPTGCGNYDADDAWTLRDLTAP